MNTVNVGPNSNIKLNIKYINIYLKGVQSIKMAMMSDEEFRDYIAESYAFLDQSRLWRENEQHKARQEYEKLDALAILSLLNISLGKDNKKEKMKPIPVSNPKTKKPSKTKPSTTKPCEAKHSMVTRSRLQRK